MKRILVYILPLLLLISCGILGPKTDLNEETPQWVLEKIEQSENHEDNLFTINIWRYIYKERFVFYCKSSKYDVFDRLYSYEGKYLGTPYGVWGLSDIAVFDFYQEKQDRTVIWEKKDFLLLDSQEEYNIINAALSANFDSITINLTPWTLYNIHPDKVIKKFKDYDIDYDPNIIRDLKSRNIDNYSLDEDRLINMVHLISPDSVTTNDIRVYHANYPNSTDMLSLRRPGISTDGNTAVVELGYDFHMGECVWWFSLMEKVNEEWVFIQNFLIMMT